MIVKGLHCIHEKGYVHCDLKLENILVFSFPDDGSSRKITDFGLSKIPRDLDELMTKCFGFRGTPDYMSPESLLLGEIQGCLDIWSLGCTVVEMISGKWAWDCTGGGEELAIEIATDSPKIPENMSEIGKDFLRRCFERDLRERWTVEMLLHHPFLLETEGPPSSTRTGMLSSSVSKTLRPPPGFESISKKLPLLQKILPPPLGFPPRSILT